LIIFGNPFPDQLIQKQKVFWPGNPTFNTSVVNILSTATALGVVTFGKAGHPGWCLLGHSVYDLNPICM
jgi:hypothetical protein